MKIKRILISQAKPETEKSPYDDLAQKTNVEIEFRPFTHVEGVTSKEFRAQKIHIPDYTALIFNSRTAIDHFFRICNELRITVPETMKYFCTSETVALYLQKYIVYRKRKVFYGNGTFPDLMNHILKHKEEKFLVPLSDQHKDEIPELLTKHGIKFKVAILYRTVYSDLSDLSTTNYDILVFFSPAGVKALLNNFPDFKQNDLKIASFGHHTAQAVREAGLRLDIEAPLPDAPSMAMALEQYILKHNKNCKK